MKRTNKILNNGRQWNVEKQLVHAGFVMFFVLSMAMPVYAQSVLSETTWGGADSDVTNGVAVAADGSTYLPGNTRSFGSSDTPIIFLVKFLNDGSVAWQRVWDGPDPFLSDDAADVALGSDGSIHVAGTTFGGVSSDGLLLRFAADGSLITQQRWDTGEGDFGQDVAAAADGSVYFVGSTRSSDPNALDMFIVKLSSAGTILWQKTWGTPDVSQEAQGVAVAPDGSIYVAGYTPSATVPFSFDIALLKLDPAGNLVWQRTYAAGDGVDSRSGVAVAPDGSVYVAGGLFDPRSSDLNAVLVKFTSAGNLVWDRDWGGARTGDDPAEVAVTSSGTVLLAGQTGLGAGGDDAFLVRFNPSGKVIDAVTWGSPDLDRAAGVGAAPNGTISLGATVSAPPPYSLLCAPSKSSRTRGIVGTPSIPLINATGVLADAGGVVSTPNGSTTYAGSFDAALVRIAPASAIASASEGLSINDDGTMQPDEAGVSDVSPSNPAPKTALRGSSVLTSTPVEFSVNFETIESPFSAEVFNIAGRRLRVLPGGVSQGGTAEVGWDLQDAQGARVPDGVYFIVVTTQSEKMTQRVVVIR